VKITPFPALTDNYIWVIEDHETAIVVDPAVSEPLLRWLEKQALSVSAIWLTHHHDDHCAGVPGLLEAFPCAHVYGPASEGIPWLTDPILAPGPLPSRPLGLSVEVRLVPGHTAAHLAYWLPDEGSLFCGDTLFSVGCGRNFEGSFETLLGSLEHLLALPDETRIFPAHEYTLANIAFAKVAEPDNPDRDAWEALCIEKRRRNEATLPSTLAIEKAINPFLRADHPSVLQSVNRHAGRNVKPGLDCFSVLRTWKNGFRP
jgi:hydroxyacylglutathione hydrolase